MSSDPNPSPKPPPVPRTQDSDQDTITGTGTTKAAILVWVLGAVEVLLGGCLSMFIAALGMTPVQELLARLPEVQHEPIEKLHPDFPAIAVVLMILTVGPGFALVVLGFFVRLGHRPLTRVTLGVVGTQAALLAFLLLMSMLGALVSHDYLALITNTIIFGGLLAFMVMILRILYRLQSQGTDDLWDTQTDPWGPPQG